MPSLVEIGPVILEEKIFIFRQHILPFRNYVPLGKGVALHLNKAKNSYMYMNRYQYQIQNGCFPSVNSSHFQQLKYYIILKINKIHTFIHVPTFLLNAIIRLFMC